MARSGRPRKHDPIADAIRQAIAYATPSEAMALIEDGGVDLLDGESRTPLMYAALAGKVELVSWLIAHGADINHQDRNGSSSLHLAVQGKQIDCVNCLLKSGATVDPKDAYGNTPLWRAVFDARGHYELARLLVAHGADPNSKNNSGRSPLDFALQVGDQQLVAELKGR